jgi:hypothetical protein
MRNYNDLSYPRCESLINSIKEEGRNREAVVVRRTNDGPLPYELLVGTRRHWSVSWLHANNHSELNLSPGSRRSTTRALSGLPIWKIASARTLPIWSAPEITCTPSKPIMAACAHGREVGDCANQPV